MGERNERMPIRESKGDLNNIYLFWRRKILSCGTKIALISFWCYALVCKPGLYLWQEDLLWVDSIKNKLYDPIFHQLLPTGNFIAVITKLIPLLFRYLLPCLAKDDQSSS
jgi:hypothetical protein